MKRAFGFFLAAVLLMTAFAILPIHGEEEVYESVIRLHVLANSDSEEDQAVKLAVRDAILDVTVPLLQDCDTREEAVRLLEENQSLFIKAAQSVLREHGFDDSVSIEMGLEDVESNPELEDNKKMLSQWDDFEKDQHKRRRAFKKKL